MKMIQEFFIKLFIALGGCVAIFLIVGYVFIDNPPPPPTKPLTKQEKIQEKVESLFSFWDGSHYQLKKLVKNNLNNPDSFKHRWTKYRMEDGDLIIRMTYSGTNAFGGVVTNSVLVRGDIEGNIVEILE